MTIINKTPHDVIIFAPNGELIKFLACPKDELLRLDQKVEPVGSLEGIPITRTIYGECKLPAEQEGTYYIVSALIKTAYPNRKDLLVPAEQVRNPNNPSEVIGCRSLGL